MVNFKEIKRRREALELTMDEAAHRAGLANRQAWNKIESGTYERVSAEALWRVSRVLMCSMEQLMLEPKGWGKIPARHSTKG